MMNGREVEEGNTFFFPRRIKTFRFKIADSPDEWADACSCYDAEPLAEGTDVVDKLASANQLAIQPS